MKRDPKAFLYDIIETADAVAMAVAALTLEDDKASRLIRSSVEHEFILICEALSKLSRVDPALFASIDQGPRIISFRNQLTHEYHNIDHVLIWGGIVGSLPWSEGAVWWIAFAVKAFGTDFRTDGCGIRALDSPETAHIRP